MSIESPALAEAARDLLGAIRRAAERPPQEAVIAHHHLDWREFVPPAGTKPLQRLLLSIRRVRNNLFHGGKFPWGPMKSDPARDSELLCHSLTALGYCAALHPGVRARFESGQAQ